MIKRIALLLVVVLLPTMLFPTAERHVGTAEEGAFARIDDSALLAYIEDSVYASLVDELDSDQFYVENVEAVYISKDYLRDQRYNTKANIYFGYTLTELEAQFEGQRYVFTLGENGETAVVPYMADPDHTLETILRNVAIGAGVILVCVTVALVTKNPAAVAGAGKAIKAVYAISSYAASEGAKEAIKAAVLRGIPAMIVEGYETGNFEKAVQAGALAASEEFKIGAIVGTAKSIASSLTHIDNTVFFDAGSDLAKKYLEGVQFTTSDDKAEVYPRFEQWAIATAKFDMPTLEAALEHTGLSGNYYWDAKLANELCGFGSTPRGYVWHHVEDMQTMILIPQDLHGSIHHTGGASLIKNYLGL